MRLNIDTYELDSNIPYSDKSSSKSTNNTKNSSSKNDSNLTDENSSSSNSPQSTDSKQQQQNQSAQFLRNLSVENWQLICSSYCRVQLFRLKGAQRKLKTDRSKVERLNPPDLRKRYQIPSKITMLYNCIYDPLYTFLPFSRDTSSIIQANLNQNHHNHQSLTSPDSSSITSFNLNNSNSISPAAATLVFNKNSSSSIDGGYQNPSQQVENNSGFTYPSIHQNLNMSDPILAEYPSFYIDINPPQMNSSCSIPLSAGIQIQQLSEENIFVSSGGNPSATTTKNRLKRSSTSINSLVLACSNNNHNTQNNPGNRSKIQRTLSNGLSGGGTTIFNCNQYQNNGSPASSMNSSSSNSSNSSSSASISSSPSSPISSAMHVSSEQQQQQMYVNNSLPYNLSNKYLQEWLINNRFSHLTQIFNNYASNDLLRLSKEDMINLCGAPDGIRCYNIAHNIQIKPKLTIFVTFQPQTYYSAVFLADWKSQFLIDKIFSLYTIYIKSLIEDSNDDNNISSENGEQLSLNDKNHVSVYNCLLGLNQDFDLFLKIKGILVKTTDEVLNNLQDQSKFLIEFDISSLSTSSCNINSCEDNIKNNNLNANNNNNNLSSKPPSNFSCENNSQQNNIKNSNCKIKIIMTPLDQ